MPYIPPEVVAKAKEMDLLTYLQNYELDELVHFSGSTYCTRTHDSLKISNGKWCWFSRGIGGKTALDYLIKVRDIPFTEAVEMIVGQAASRPPAYAPPVKKDAPKVLLLPPANHSATHAVSYLRSRGIDEEVIDFCLSTGRLYESGSRYHNVVFVGHDRYGKARYANLRGVGSDFKGECNGSDKRFSFNIPAENSGLLHLFESAIDLLSFATIRKMNEIDWRKDHLLSLAGVYQPREKIVESAVPLALSQYLQDHPEIKTIILRLDNDRAGHLATKALMMVPPRHTPPMHDFHPKVRIITTTSVCTWGYPSPEPDLKTRNDKEIDNMKEFEITLIAVSKKCFHLKADSKEDALSLAETILEDTDLLAFSDEDVSSMEMSCEEQCGGVCEICSQACEYCGNCTKSDGQLPDISGAEHCPVCGGVIFADTGD